MCLRKLGRLSRVSQGCLGSIYVVVPFQIDLPRSGIIAYMLGYNIHKRRHPIFQ
jgi:hypothetical protein